MSNEDQSVGNLYIYNIFLYLCIDKTVTKPSPTQKYEITTNAKCNMHYSVKMTLQVSINFVAMIYEYMLNALKYLSVTCYRKAKKYSEDSQSTSSSFIYRKNIQGVSAMLTKFISRVLVS